MAVAPPRPLSPDPALAGLSPAKALEALSLCARAAVQDRLAAARGLGLAAGLEFSGGLDSGLIACLMAEGGGEIAAFAAVPGAGTPRSDELAAEAAARAALARRLPGLTITEIPPDGADFFAGADHYEARGLPCPDPTAFAALHLARRMAEAGIGAALTGMGGDFCLSSHARPTLPELWRAGGPGAAWREVAARRALGGRLRNVLIGDLVKPSAAFGWWMTARPGAPEPLLAASALTPALAARMAASGRAWRHRRGWSMAAEEAAALAALPAWTLQDLSPLGAHHEGQAGGLSRLSPLLDGALVAAALAMPPSLRLFPAHDIPGGLTRGLVRRLLAPHAPELAARRGKAAFQPDYPRLQAEALPRIRAEARAFAGIPEWREVVDEAAWAAVLDRAERAQGMEGFALSNAVMTPYFLGRWLARL